MEEIRQRVLAFVEDKCLTKRALAEAIGYNEKTLGNKMSGRRDFDASDLFKILSAYPELSAEWLMRGEGDMYIKMSTEEEMQVDAKIKSYVDGKIKEALEQLKA